MKKEIILIVGFMLAFSILLVACGNDKKRYPSHEY